MKETMEEMRMDKNEAVKKLAQVAQKCFETDKAAILNAMADRLNQIDKAETEDEVDEIVKNYMYDIWDADDLTIINPEAFNFDDDDYREISVLYKHDGDELCSIPRIEFDKETPGSLVNAVLFESVIHSFLHFMDAAIGLADEERELIDGIWVRAYEGALNEIRRELFLERYFKIKAQ